MVFYAYVKQITDDWSYRYVITFASREIADEWWRAVSTSTVGSFVSSVQRVNAHFYTHNILVANSATSLTTAGVANQFIGKVFFTLMNDQVGRDLSIIPPCDHFTDHISGNSFFIRSKVSPHEYWYCAQGDNSVYLSLTERTRFFVTRDSQGTAGSVIIGSDDIIITLTTSNLSINVVTASGQVIVSPDSKSGLKFSDLLNKFTARPLLNQLGDKTRKLFFTDNGEEWELA
ncbi:hypothetical protein BDR07DRAFT_1481610 [Suillus spraguei]|nr:hypothetical protein BDR07DRAFT_1481610 [Suillus spraguei]